ncbi:hypothetical protein C8R42DRAFT_778760 [Lentinula raphanica]|nr:hypothetical protein C8R42DRAFT_778760 [Lentinula raphanica]
MILYCPSRAFAVCITLSAVFLGVESSPLAISPLSYNSSSTQLEQRGEWDRRVYNLPIRLMRKGESGDILEKAKVTANEDWAIFIGTDGFQAHPGPSGTLAASRVQAPRSTGGTLIKLQDLGEKASFGSPEAKAKALQGLLTDIPALHKGNGVPQTNLAYLNGIFAYLASSKIRVVTSSQPPEEWMKLYNEMHALKGDAS